MTSKTSSYSVPPDSRRLYVSSPTSPLDSLRSWSSNALLVAQQYVGEHLGRRTRTLSDPETTAHVAALRDQQRQFVHLLQLATSLTTQLQHVVQTQRCLGDALSELSQSGGDVPLGEQFSSSSDTLKLISKNGETLLSMSSNLLWQHSIREHNQNVKVAPKNWHHFFVCLNFNKY